MSLLLCARYRAERGEIITGPQGLFLGTEAAAAAAAFARASVRRHNNGGKTGDGGSVGVDVDA